jgi:peptidoglycan/LPS O-acetylase OafA/YrhL
LIPALTILGLLLIAPTDISGWARLSLQLAFTWLLAACVFREGHVLHGLLTLPPVRRIGVVSYGIYLLHIFAIAIAVSLLGKLGVTHVLLIFAASLLLSVIVAEISFRLWETPFLRLKKRFMPRDGRSDGPLAQESEPARR